MNSPVQVVQPTSNQTIRPGQVLIKGRLRARRSFTTQQGRQIEHLIILPAPDSFSSPQTISVLSNSSLGEKDEDITILCHVGGYTRTYKAADADGEVKQVVTANNTLRAVE